MRNAIPKAIAYAKNVNAIENHSFQKWLQEKVDKEDLIWWAQKDHVRELRPDTTPKTDRKLGKAIWGLISQLTP